MKYLFLTLLIYFLFSCKDHRNILINTTITQNIDFPNQIKLEGNIIEIEAIGIEEFFLVDSFLIVNHSRDSMLITIFNLNNLQKTGTYLLKGRGPEEFTNFSYRNQYFHDSTGTNLYFTDINKREIYKVCMNKLISDKKNSISTIASLSGISHPTFILNKNEYISKVFKKADSHVSYIISDYAGQEIKEYPLYKIDNHDRFNQIASSDIINNTGTKIALGMSFFDQINIIDLPTNKYHSISISNKSLFMTEDEIVRKDILYYLRLCSYKNLIFALYINKERMNWARGNNERSIIHVFDWDGNPITRITLKEDIAFIALDAVSNKLYGLTTDEKIYVYDLPSFLKQYICNP